MGKISQISLIKQRLNELLVIPGINKNKIYTQIEEELGFPRPTIRRGARELKEELLKKIRVLQNHDIHETDKSRNKIKYSCGCFVKVDKQEGNVAFTFCPGHKTVFALMKQLGEKK